ncbi:MAG: bifunctional nuclease family protein [Acidimicrobiia bacterium]|nr:bifunctional nuclease family protein [Acidimicrobiia bacterium]
MVEVELVTVRVEMPSNTSVVLLRERSGDRRLLPILIGNAEATAIAYALDGLETPRPMTHDLMKNLLDDLAVSLDQVIVTELRDRTFYAELKLRTGAGLQTISSRPSDAIALAVRTGTPIYVAETVLAEAAYREEEQKVDQDEVVEEFRRFIDNVSPDDFAS